MQVRPSFEELFKIPEVFFFFGSGEGGQGVGMMKVEAEVQLHYGHYQYTLHSLTFDLSNTHYY